MPKPVDSHKIEKAVAKAGQTLIDELGSLTAASENGHFRPTVIHFLDAMGIKARAEQPLKTALGNHPFDIVWNDGSSAAAIELKLAKAKTEKQHALVFGTSVNLPTTFCGRDASPLPKSDDAKIRDLWFHEEGRIAQVQIAGEGAKGRAAGA